MPQKQVILEDKVYTFPDDATEAEILEVLESMSPTRSEISQAKVLPPGGPVPQSAFDPIDPNTLDYQAQLQAGDYVVDALKGAGKGVMSTIYGGGDLIRQGVNMLPGVTVDRPLQNPELKQALQPTNTAQKVGNFAEQTAEFMVPASRAAKLTTGATGLPGVLARAGTQAATAGAVGAAQEGSLSGGIAPAVVAGAAPIIGAGLREIGKHTMGSALESGLGDAAKKMAGKDLKALSAEQIQELRQDLINAALEFKLTGSMSPKVGQYIKELEAALSRLERINVPAGISSTASVVRPARIPIVGALEGKFPVLPENEASRILARRPPTPINWTELAAIGAGGTYMGGPLLGGLASLLRLAGKHYPAQAGIAANELGKAVSSPAAGAIGAGVSRQLEEELRKRSSR